MKKNFQIPVYPNKNSKKEKLNFIIDLHIKQRKLLFINLNPDLNPHYLSFISYFSL